MVVVVGFYQSSRTFQGQEVGKCDFLTRLTCIEREIIGPRHEKIKAGQLDKAKEPFSVRLKPFWDISEVRKVSVFVVCFLYMHERI